MSLAVRYTLEDILKEDACKYNSDTSQSTNTILDPNQCGQSFDTTKGPTYLYLFGAPSPKTEPQSIPTPPHQFSADDLAEALRQEQALRLNPNLEGYTWETRLSEVQDSRTQDEIPDWHWRKLKPQKEVPNAPRGPKREVDSYRPNYKRDYHDVDDPRPSPASDCERKPKSGDWAPCRGEAFDEVLGEDRLDYSNRKDESWGRQKTVYDSDVAANPLPNFESVAGRTLKNYASDSESEENKDVKMEDTDVRNDAPRRNGGYNQGGNRGYRGGGGGNRGRGGYRNNDRNDNYRGGNNNYQDGGNRGRKRGHDETEEDDRNQRGGNHNDRNGGDRRNKQRRYEQPPAARLRKELLALGTLRYDTDAQTGAKVVISQNGRSREEECAVIGTDVAMHWDDYQVRGDLLDTMILLMLEQPLKIPFVAAIILHTHEKTPEASKEMAERVTARIQDCLDGGKWKEFKLLVRFLALTQSMWDGDGVFSLLDELFDRAADFQAASSSDAVGLELVQIILLTIPYIMAWTAGQDAKAQELLVKTDIIASASVDHELGAVVNAFPTDSSEKPYGFVSAINLLQQQIQQEATNGWKLECIPRLFQRTAKMDNGIDIDAKKMPLPTMNIPSPANPGGSAFFPRTYFSIYSNQEIDTVPPSTHIASFLLRDAVVDTIDVADFAREHVAKQLIEIEYYWTTGTFCPRGTKPDAIKMIEPGKSTWKTEDVALDGVFSQIFVLPAPQHKMVYYHSVITEVCRAAPRDIAPCLGRAIRYLFNYADIMDYELTYRFLDWFSHHLSNFDFRWKWEEWVPVLEQPNFYPKKAFITGVLDKEIRLSFAKRIKQTLPKEYQPLITSGQTVDQPEFKYKHETTPYSAEGKELLNLLRKKQPEEEIQAVIDKIHAQAQEQGVADPLVPSTDAYVTAICFIGSKSTSHILAHIERCKERLIKIGQESEAGRAQIVQSVVDYWHDLPGTAVNIIDKLLNYGIVSPEGVIRWAIGPEGLGSGQSLSDSWRFEMVLATINKVTHRVRQIASHRATVIAQAEGDEMNESGGMPAEQVALIDTALAKERDEQMGQLFTLIADLLSPTSDGSSDALLAARETPTNALTDPDVAAIQSWAHRWIAVFRRKQIVEQAIVGPAAVLVQTAVAEANRRLEARKAAEEKGREEKMERERAERRAAEDKEREEAEKKAAVEAEQKNGVEKGTGEDLDVADADADGIE